MKTSMALISGILDEFPLPLPLPSLPPFEPLLSLFELRLFQESANSCNSVLNVLKSWTGVRDVCMDWEALTLLFTNVLFQT